MRVHQKFDNESHPLADVDLAHSAGYTGSGSVIAIIDDGIDHDHAAFGGQASFPNDKFLGGYDFADNDADPTHDCNEQSHGTAVTGVAIGDGGGVTGVAPDAKAVFLKVQSASNCGLGTLGGDVIAAVDWVVDNQATYNIDIISMSFGGGSFSSVAACDASESAYFNAFQAAANAGISIFAASGNDGLCDQISQPACFSNVISVGAVYDENLGDSGWCVSPSSCADTEFHISCAIQGRVAAFEVDEADNVIVYSNSASFLDITAPSTCANTAEAGGDTNECFGGTSSATPFAAGVGALAVSAAGKGELDNEDMRSLLSSTGDTVNDPKNGRSSPRVNGFAAADAADNGGGNSCTATSMHVSSISVNRVRVQGRNRAGTAEATMIDDCNQTVSSASVTGTFTGYYTGTKTESTNAGGIADLQSDTSSGRGSFTFCVDSVSGSLTYNAGDNAATCESF
jgi:subtilisin family serine protease